MEGMSAKRALATAGAAVGIAVGVAGAAAGVTAAVTRKLAHRVVEVDRGLERPVRVLGVTEGASPAVWLEGEGVAAAGQQSLLFSAPTFERSSQRGRHAAVEGASASEDLAHFAGHAGHARLGPVIAKDGRAVLREIVRIDSGELVAGASGRMVGWWYTHPAELGYPVEEIEYDSELGPMTAWIVHPKKNRKKRWAIHIHGRGASPIETVRGVTPFVESGVTSMIIAYRNDPGQPGGSNDRYGMGISEARDVEAAIAEARARGAQRVTLMGWSMGGTAALVTLANGKHRDIIDGVVLDSPGADWADIVRDKTRQAHLPGWVAGAGMRLLESGAVASGEDGGINMLSLRPEELAKHIDVPTLILASPDDRYVPWDGARRIAAARPDLVQFVSVPGAGHVRLWNVDPDAWEQRVKTFVSQLPKPGWRGQ